MAKAYKCDGCGTLLEDPGAAKLFDLKLPNGGRVEISIDADSSKQPFVLCDKCYIGAIATAVRELFREIGIGFFLSYFREDIKNIPYIIITCKIE